jgi:hypothetical protein
MKAQNYVVCEMIEEIKVKNELKPIIKGYFLGYEQIYAGMPWHYECWRWIENTAVGYKIFDLFRAVVVPPLGSPCVLEPYIFFGMNYKEMMRQKEKLNAELRKNEGL